MDLRRVPGGGGGQEKRTTGKEGDCGARFISLEGDGERDVLVKKNSATRVPGAVWTMSYGFKRPIPKI